MNTSAMADTHPIPKPRGRFGCGPDGGGRTPSTPSIVAMRIACLGGAHLDTKAHLINAPRLATSNPATISRSPGGVACNVARNLARLGAEVVLCSLVGDDDAATALRETLGRDGVDDSGLLTHPRLPTAGYLAVLEPDGSLMIGIADMSIYDAVDAAWVSRAVERAAGADLWVLDANLPERILAMLVDRAPVPVLADPVSVAKAIRLRSIMGRLAGVFPDRSEAAVLAEGEPGRPGYQCGGDRSLWDRVGGGFAGSRRRPPPPGWPRTHPTGRPLRAGGRRDRGGRCAAGRLRLRIGRG